MQKAFSLSRSCAFALRVGKKTFPVQKKPLKIKTVYFGCRKRFLCPDAVLLHCEWAKTFPVQEKPLKNKNGLFRMQKAFSLSRSCNKLLRVGKKTFSAPKEAVF